MRLSRKPVLSTGLQILSLKLSDQLRCSLLSSKVKSRAHLYQNPWSMKGRDSACTKIHYVGSLTVALFLNTDEKKHPQFNHCFNYTIQSTTTEHSNIPTTTQRQKTVSLNDWSKLIAFKVQVRKISERRDSGTDPGNVYSHPQYSRWDLWYSKLTAVHFLFKNIFCCIFKSYIA